MALAEWLVRVVTSLGYATTVIAFFRQLFELYIIIKGRHQNGASQPKSPPARNLFVTVVVITMLLVGFSSLAMGEPIYGLQSPEKEIFCACLAFGTGMVVLSLFMPMPKTLQIERIGMAALATLLLPYSIFLIAGLIIENSMLRYPTWILFVGYGIACTVRSLQITRHVRQYQASLVDA